MVLGANHGMTWIPRCRSEGLRCPWAAGEPARRLADPPAVSPADPVRGGSNERNVAAAGCGQRAGSPRHGPTWRELRVSNRDLGPGLSLAVTVGPGLEAAVPRLGRESFSASSGLESGSPTNGSATELWLEGVPPPPPRQTKKYVTHTVPDLLVFAGSALSGPESEPHPGPSPAGLPA